MIQSLHSIAITATSSLLRIVPPLQCTSLISASSFCDLCLFVSHCFAGSCVSLQSLLYAHAALIPVVEQSSLQDNPLLLSPSSGEGWVLTTFYAIDTSSAVHFHSSSYNLHDRLDGLFPVRSLPQFFTAAATGLFDESACTALTEGSSFISAVTATAHHHRTYRSVYGGSKYTHPTGAFIIRWMPFMFAAEAN